MKKSDIYFTSYLGIGGLIGTGISFYAVYFNNNLMSDKFSLTGIGLAFLSFSFLAISNFTQDKRNREIDKKFEHIIDSLNKIETSIEKDNLETRHKLTDIRNNIADIKFQKNTYSLLSINCECKQDLKRK